jgi:DUF971 family protein
MNIIPEKIESISDIVITITWNDGHDSVYFADHLRKNCPCAACRSKSDETDQQSPFKILNSSDQSIALSFSKWSIMGRYALAIHFSDGHHSGIFTFDLLRELCQCDLCKGDSIRIKGPFK